jgi:hypothetical protein
MEARARSKEGTLFKTMQNKSMKGLLWRKILGTGLLVIATAVATRWAGASPAQIVATFNWDPSPDQSVVGYALYYGMANLPTTNRVDAGASLTASVPLLVSSNYSLYVAAYTAVGVESLPSNIVNYTPPPLSHLRLSKLSDDAISLQFMTSPLVPCRIEYTPGLNPPQWQVLESVAADASGNVVVTDPPTGRPATRYYRAVKP